MIFCSKLMSYKIALLIDIDRALDWNGWSLFTDADADIERDVYFNIYFVKFLIF